MATRMTACANCGGPLTVDAFQRIMVCAHCGSQFPIPDESTHLHNNNTYNIEHQTIIQQGESYDDKVSRCEVYLANRQIQYLQEAEEELIKAFPSKSAGYAFKILRFFSVNRFDETLQASEAYIHSAANMEGEWQTNPSVRFEEGKRIVASLDHVLGRERDLFALIERAMNADGSEPFMERLGKIKANLERGKALRHSAHSIYCLYENSKQGIDSATLKAQAMKKYRVIWLIAAIATGVFLLLGTIGMAASDKSNDSWMMFIQVFFAAAITLVFFLIFFIKWNGAKKSANQIVETYKKIVLEARKIASSTVQS